MSLRPPPPVQPSRQPSKRAAPPSLFVGPPSPDGPSTDQLQSPTTASSSPQNTTTSTQASTRPAINTSSPTYSPNQSQTQPQTQSQSKVLGDRQRQPSATAQTWRALQSTFEEVELNALNGASVFGAEHSHALEELRKAQVELARAWARGEGDGEGDDTSAATSAGGGRDVFGDGFRIGPGGEDTGKSDDGTTTSGGRSAVLSRERDKLGASGRRDAVGSGGARDGAAAKKSGFNNEKKSALEEETENDILLARKRRQANDRYFERVNKGVVDVVAKLESVAQKMGGVEMESQEIWGDDSDSGEGGSI